MQNILQKDSRQIPKDKKFTANKQYCDLVYAYFQVNSEFDAERKIRYIPKKDIVFSQIGRNLGISRQTVAKKFKNLIELKLIIFNENSNQYELSILEKDIALLIPKDTLRQMVSALSEHCISVYTYLYNRYFANKLQGFEFTMASVKNAVGISEATRSNDYIIKDIFKVLEKLGLLEYIVISDAEKAKTKFKLISMSNTIK